MPIAHIHDERSDKRIATIKFIFDKFYLGRRVVASNEYELCNWATKNGCYLIFI